MEHNRTHKLLMIIALVLSIAGMTLGFAAFSTTLNISSSATVTPNSEDFKIVIYGVNDKSAYETFDGTTDSDLSDSFGYAWDDGARSDVASIDNTTHTISNLKAYFENDNGLVDYYFVIRNEGKYDAYLDLSNMFFDSESNDYAVGNILTQTCTPGEGTTASLVEETCESIFGLFIFGYYDEYGMFQELVTTESYYKIPVGGQGVLLVEFQNLSSYADGPFDVKFDDINLNFSTTKSGE